LREGPGALSYKNSSCSCLVAVITPDVLRQKFPDGLVRGSFGVRNEFLLSSSGNFISQRYCSCAHIDLAAAVHASIASIIQHANRVDAQICARIQCRRAGCEIKIVGCGGHVDVQGIGELSMYVLR
jgi:hypothetical protein